MIAAENSMSASSSAVGIPIDNAMDDARLLLDYVATGSQSAFAQIVRRHVDLVYATALRHVRDAQLAQDIAQAVFLLLARKARSLRHETVLAAWLLQATRYASLDAVKLRDRRQRHEMEAAQVNSAADRETSADTSAQRAELLGMLDTALARLSEGDRRVLVLRFYEKRSFPEIGAVLGVTDESARKRVNRSVEKLRASFARRGSRIATAGAVALISAALGDCAHAAPLSLADRAGAAASVGELPANIAAAVARKMLMIQVRLLVAVVCVGLLMCVLGGVLVHSLMLSRAHHVPGPSTPMADEHDRSG
jgi:RNA polymerase sigma factor (sigma-70 family)